MHVINLGLSNLLSTTKYDCFVFSYGVHVTLYTLRREISYAIVLSPESELCDYQCNLCLNENVLNENKIPRED